MLVDTHCHIHEPDYALPVSEVLRSAAEAGVSKMICVGTSVDSTKQAIAFAATHAGCYVSVGVHPHDTKDGYAIDSFAAADKVVAVGEIGLDYYYSHSPKDVQIAALKAQIEVALAYNLPIIFHVRDAFDDFWPVIDAYEGIRGVLHSFTDSVENMRKAVKKGLYIGVNGISTFTKDQQQLEMFDEIPIEKLLFETDAPFLTPVPFRGKVNEPALVTKVAEFHANRRNLSVEALSDATTANAHALFAL